MSKDQKSAVENFLEGTDEQVVSFEQPKDPFEQEIEQKEEEGIKEEIKEEKPVPFHKDPKVQKFIDRELERRLKDLKPADSINKEDKNDDDDYYARLIGNDTPEKVAMIKEAKARDERILEQAEERAFDRLSQREQEELQADQEAEDELANAFESIEEAYDVDISSNSTQAKKTRQEFISFVEKIAPKRNGEIIDFPDMNSAWETFSEIKKSTTPPSRAKDIASRSTIRSADTTTKAPERVDWNKVEEFMDTLK